MQTRSLEEKVQHALRMLPYYGVFDEIRFSVEGDTVTLAGSVVRPTLKSDAQYAVANVDGVITIINGLEILPLSRADDALRLNLYRAVYSQPGFEKYAIQAAKPIRIVVRNGDVKLVGVVGSQLDKAIAGTAARNVPFAFSVTNDLIIG
jgi:osmotically-inducible protein OsmY